MFIEELAKKQTIIKSKVTISRHSFLKKFDADPYKDQELPLSIERLLSKYDEVQSQIEALTDIDMDERTKFEDVI